MLAANQPTIDTIKPQKHIQLIDIGRYLVSNKLQRQLPASIILLNKEESLKREGIWSNNGKKIFKANSKGNAY